MTSGWFPLLERISAQVLALRVRTYQLQACSLHLIPPLGFRLPLPHPDTPRRQGGWVAQVCLCLLGFYAVKSVSLSLFSVEEAEPKRRQGVLPRSTGESSTDVVLLCSCPWLVWGIPRFPCLAKRQSLPHSIDACFPSLPCSKGMDLWSKLHQSHASFPELDSRLEPHRSRDHRELSRVAVVVTRVAETSAQPPSSIPRGAAPLLEVMRGTWGLNPQHHGNLGSDWGPHSLWTGLWTVIF